MEVLDSLNKENCRKNLKESIEEVMEKGRMKKMIVREIKILLKKNNPLRMNLQTSREHKEKRKRWQSAGGTFMILIMNLSLINMCSQSSYSKEKR
jgi:hypothetical protein